MLYVKWLFKTLISHWECILLCWQLRTFCSTEHVHYKKYANFLRLSHEDHMFWVQALLGSWTRNMPSSLDGRLQKSPLPAQLIFSVKYSYTKGSFRIYILLVKQLGFCFSYWKILSTYTKMSSGNFAHTTHSACISSRFSVSPPSTFISWLDMDEKFLKEQQTRRIQKESR